ncbi:MAG: hypothetical protein COW67_11705 [Flavobacteriales bacterium CG18_big_fil_WC_8_21_14_2_50_32_9]|nr:hypothetical protein [Flavobacteriales bacterium]NCT16524.1 hypothetical protein [Flavobacteriales bacterium]PIQ14830.1 MAG: hypothetical protein COW67_11705 [Flavobacteriales bacterium CG18_big_fil_WC_8_21_14_2_50_32_9]PJC63132.1 MAG: hypothetical protein CO022_00850 [Flavobacteriales bacterium CG_4_9_14_0_2_um_filter_32_27]
MKKIANQHIQFNKNCITIVSFILIILWSSNIRLGAQSISNKVDFTEKPSEEFVIKQFTAVQHQDKIYFKFLIVENRVNVNYVLESSTNGVDFVEVQKKEGFKSPNEIPLLYCYTIDEIDKKVKAYRIRLESINTIEYSSRVIVEKKNISELLSDKETKF